jgi:hypothetical protein
VRNPKDSWTGNKYHALRGLVPYIELAFGAYFSYLVAQAILSQQWAAVPFVLIFQVGFLYVGLMSLMQSSVRLMRRSDVALSPASA